MGLLPSIVLSIVGYFVLMFITTNLTGMVVRGFFRDTNLEKLKKDKKTHSFIKQEIVKNDRADDIITIVFIIISILFLYSLYHFFNIWAFIAALLLIIIRVPDLSWEIRTGKKITANDRQKGGLNSITDIMSWVALPILWWSLYSL